MNCPECGRFMALLIAFEAAGFASGLDVEASAYWWVCNNDDHCWQHEHPIAAPEYNWTWQCETIPLNALLDSPELRTEYEQMWERLPASWKKRFVNVLERNPADEV